MSARLLGAKQRFSKEIFQQTENLRSARCLPFVISKVLAARMRKLITARARKNKRTARMLANARKDHSIPVIVNPVVKMRPHPAAHPHLASYKELPPPQPPEGSFPCLLVFSSIYTSKLIVDFVYNVVKSRHVIFELEFMSS